MPRVMHVLRRMCECKQSPSPSSSTPEPARCQKRPSSFFLSCVSDLVGELGRTVANMKMRVDDVFGRAPSRMSVPQVLFVLEDFPSSPEDLDSWVRHSHTRGLAQLVVCVNVGAVVVVVISVV